MLTLPRGTGSDTAFALRIAGDAAKLQAAVAYWRARLSAAGEQAMDTGAFTSDALKFAAAVPVDAMARLLPEFAGFFEPADEDAMISRSGCLTSTRDLAGIAPGLSEEHLAGELKFLSGFDPATSASQADLARLAAALRLAREVFDLGRRFDLCTANALAVGLPRSELIAIYHQEGALGISPPQSSWPHAPLVPTTDSGCRTHSISLWDRSALRHAFIVSHEQEAADTPSRRDPVSLSFGLAIRQMIVVAGLDQDIDPRLADDDELLALYTCMRSKPAGTYPALDRLKADVLAKLSTKPAVQPSIRARQRSIASQADVFDGLCIGLFSDRLERIDRSADLPPEAHLLDLVKADVAALLEAHPGQTEAGRVFLAAREDSADARFCLEHQAGWYASRKRIVTLLARRDRDAYRGPPALDPILAYLRYNIGEFNFVRCLIWFAHRLAELKTARARRDLPLSEPFVQALSRIQWDALDAKVADRLWEAWQQLSRTALFKTPGWRHVGLIDALAARGRPCATAAPASKTMENAADAVQAAVTLYTEENLFPLLATFVLTHPLKVSIGKVNVVGLTAADSLRPMRNAFSFERLRRVYAKAVAGAGLPDVPPATPP